MLKEKRDLVMGKISTFNHEIIFDFVLMILGIVIIIVSLGYGFGNLAQPGAGLYTFFVGLIFLTLSVPIFVSSLRHKSSEPLFDRYGLKRFLLMTITFTLWIVVMPFLGYVMVTLIGTYCFCKIMGLEGWLKPLALSIGIALFIYLLFDYWLYIDLPRGIL